jgi:hypothetical protein
MIMTYFVLSAIGAFALPVALVVVIASIALSSLLARWRRSLFGRRHVQRPKPRVLRPSAADSRTS